MVQLRDVYIVDGNRTPFLKARGVPGPFSATDLAVQTCRTLLLRQNFPATAIDEVITGCVMPNADEANISRLVALRVGCGHDVPAWTVQRNCASGMQSLDNARVQIGLGRSEIVLAGGVEAMSRAPLLFEETMATWLGGFMGSRTPIAKLRALLKFRPHYLKPVIALLRGLNDPVIGLSMGQTAEKLALRFEITRREMDDFACRSQLGLANAQQQGYLSEINPIFHGDKYFDHDDGVRADTSVEKLGKLRPTFDKKYGNVTAGNSSQVTDGACFLILASRDAVKKYNLPVRGKIVDCDWAALDPAQMGLGPIHASTKLLTQQKLGLSDIDYWEINEAFAAQVLACRQAWADDDYCQKELGLTAAFGEIPLDQLNIDGGAISVGHPVGASGARISLHLLSVLERQQANRGVAALCIGGGQGGAILIERVSKV